VGGRAEAEGPLDQVEIEPVGVTLEHRPQIGRDIRQGSGHTSSWVARVARSRDNDDLDRARPKRGGDPIGSSVEEPAKRAVRFHRAFQKPLPMRMATDSAAVNNRARRTGPAGHRLCG
jgi:hypothetical protein